MTDLHSHILSGLDDGARSPAESLAMLAAARAAGVTELVATPHVRDVCFDADAARARLDALRPEADALGVVLRLGFEVDVCVMAALGAGAMERYCVEGTRALLLELHRQALPPDLERIVYALQREGMIVILAHPERYLAADCVRARRLADMGCELQIDAMSLFSGRLRPDYRGAAAMLRRGLATWVASDAHEAGDFTLLGLAMEGIPPALLRPTAVKALSGRKPA